MPNSTENDHSSFRGTQIDNQEHLAIVTPKPESVSTKFYREVDLAWSGLRDGVAAGAREACHHPMETVGKFAFATAAGFGLTALSRNPGLGAAVARGITTGLSASFLFDLADPHRLSKIRDTLSDTWNSGAHLELSKQQLASATGEFTFDALPMMCAGAVGAEGTLIPTKVHVRAVPIELKKPRLRLPNGIRVEDDGDFVTGLAVQHTDCIDFWDFPSPKFKAYREPDQTVAVRFSDGSLLKSKPGEFTRFDQVTGVDQMSHKLITYKPRLTMLQELGHPHNERHFWFDEAKDHFVDDEPKECWEVGNPGAKLVQYDNGDTHLRAQNADLVIEGGGKLREITTRTYKRWILDDHDVLHPPVIGKPNLPPMPKIAERNGKHLIGLANGVHIELDPEGNARVWDQSGRLHTDHR